MAIEMSQIVDPKCLYNHKEVISISTGLTLIYKVYNLQHNGEHRCVFKPN